MKEERGVAMNVDVDLRRELEPLPPKMRHLPVDHRGFVVPYFVAWIDGVPDHRIVDGRKWPLAVRDRLCWVCGGQLGRHLSFALGPMCAVNRVNAEPPSHLECATWSARNCPFLSRSHMHRREVDRTELEVRDPAGMALTRNPGVTGVWTTTSFRVFKAGTGPLIEIGPPEHVEWYCEGRTATREEVRLSTDSGLPKLIEACALEAGAERQREALEALLEKRQAVEALWPRS